MSCQPKPTADQDEQEARDAEAECECEHSAARFLLGSAAPLFHLGEADLHVGHFVESAELNRPLIVVVGCR